MKSPGPSTRMSCSDPSGASRKIFSRPVCSTTEIRPVVVSGMSHLARLPMGRTRQRLDLFLIPRREVREYGDT